jgi:REP element-mobilizing transposase RayT
MSSHPDRSGLRVPHHRRTIRLPGYDDAQPGTYFVTICTRHRRHLFGEIIDRRLHLNARGWWARRCWLEIPRHFRHVELDAFVIMPDHVHGIIRITDDAPTASGDRIADVRGVTAAFGHPPPRALSAIVGSFKAAAARAIGAGWDRPRTIIWQRNYHEHIIRNEETLRRIRRYIETNPERWGAL